MHLFRMPAFNVTHPTWGRSWDKRTAGGGRRIVRLRLMWATYTLSQKQKTKTNLTTKTKQKEDSRYRIGLGTEGTVCTA
jgi:hypothetical protein